MDVLEFLSKTDCYSGLVFAASHQSFRHDFVRDCFEYYSESGVNLLDYFQDFYTMFFMGEDYLEIDSDTFNRCLIAYNHPIIKKHWKKKFLDNQMVKIKSYYKG